MGHYLDGEEGKVFVKMYKGEAVGISFPTDGSKHNEKWNTINLPLIPRIHINHYENGEVISVEIDLPKDVIDLETSVS